MLFLHLRYCVSGDYFLGRRNAIEDVQWSLDRLDDFLRDFTEIPHQKDVLYFDKVKQWFRCIRVSSERLLHMRRLNPSTQRTDILKAPVRVKGYQLAA